VNFGMVTVGARAAARNTKAINPTGLQRLSEIGRAIDQSIGDYEPLVGLSFDFGARNSSRSGKMRSSSDCRPKIKKLARDLVL
jgi:hypothetical protein